MSKTPETPEIVPNPKLPAVRMRASRIRKEVSRGAEVSTEDAEFLASYDATAGQSMSASRNSRRVMVEEESATMGTGDAAIIAASAAQAREEGKRLDTLTKTVMDMAKMTSDICKDMANTALGIMKQLSDRNESLEKAHVQMFESMRKARLDQVDAEIDLMEAEAERAEKPDIVGDLAQGLLQGLQSQGHLPGGAKKS